MKLFIVDSYAFLFKNYYALPKFMTSKGEEVGALYGFVRIVLKLKENSNYIVACYDCGKSFRKDISFDYKANRKEVDKALLNQIKLSKEVLNKLGIKTVEKEGYEADDIIATITKKAVSNGLDVVIVGADKDLLQLVSEKVRVMDLKGNIQGIDEVYKKYGIYPDKLLTYFVLVGDCSDNVDGVSGIGPKTALKIIKEYGDIDSILKACENSDDKYLLKIKNSIDKINLARKLIELSDNVPFEFNIDDFKVSFDKKNILDIAKRFEFKNLLDIVDASDLKDNVKADYIKTDEFVNIKKEYISIDDKYVCYENFYTDFNSNLYDVLKSDDLVKYFYNFKNILYNKKGLEEINNFHDIYIAYHLVHGGIRKPEINKIIQENFFIKTDFPILYFKKIMDVMLKKIEEENMIEVYKNELELSKVLYYMENTGVKVDIKKMDDILFYFNDKVDNLKNEFYKICGYNINLNSSKQVSKLLFNKMNLKIDDKYAKFYTTKTGNYSTSEDVLKLLLPYAPDVIGIILKYREYVKLKSFIETIKEFIKDGRIHTHFEQASTQTGRLSSYDPNLQNIPVKTFEGQKIRGCFIPQDGYSFVSFDYSQIDLRVLAYLSGDELLVESFKKNEDVHIKTASAIFNIPEDLVTEELRKIAKTINFGVIYGQTPIGLSVEANISLDDAKKYIDDYFKKYSGVKKWIDMTINFAKLNGYVKNFINRKRRVPDILSVNRALRMQSERIAINMPVQSGSSDIIKKAMIEIYKDIKHNDDISMLLQIHDELLFEIKDDMIDKYIEKIKYIMENVYLLNVPLKVDVKIGKNWAELEKWK